MQGCWELQIQTGYNPLSWMFVLSIYSYTLFTLRIRSYSYIYWSIQQMEQEIKLGTTKIPLFQSGPNISWRQLTSDFN